MLHVVHMDAPATPPLPERAARRADSEVMTINMTPAQLAGLIASSFHASLIQAIAAGVCTEAMAMDICIAAANNAAGQIDLIAQCEAEGC